MESPSNMDCPPFCARGCGYFGTAANKNMCSKCYKDFLLKETLFVRPTAAPAMVASVEKPHYEVAVSASESSSTATSETNDDDQTSVATKKRCQSCNKKLGPAEVIGLKCRCGGLFCARHRLAESHSCSVNYKKRGEELLAKQNPLCKGDKLEDRI